MVGTNEHKRAILIIDVDADQRLLLRRCLKKYEEEFPVMLEADSVAAALLVIRDHMPLCCLLNCRLPGQHALTPLMIMRDDYPADVLPIVVLADENEEDVSLQMLRNGAQDYLGKKDITPARLYGSIGNAVRASELQKQLKHLAHYDVLTGLLNRGLLMNRLEQALKRCDRYKQRATLLAIDIDSFKLVNEAHGHSIGDELLQKVADRIRSNCRSTDSPARLGGDEFVVLLEQANARTGRQVADKVLATLNKPFEVADRTISICASIGLATYPDTAHSAEDLLQQADQALVKAKKHRSAPIITFSEQHRHHWNRQQILERELPQAIAQGKLALVYQPIVRADNFELERLEVLSRWPREDYAVPALELMEMIDHLSLTEPFHEWLFHTAFGQLNRWQKEFISPDLCLNVPANYCHSTVISDCIEQAIRAYAIAPEKVELEITESTLMRYPDRSIRMLQKLHDKGFRIAIDDFGTGYSSMAYLTRLPLDTLKIDRGFFLTDTNKERNRKVVEGIAALGHSLELEIIAEGVETDVQLAVARKVGCDLLQGYYFGRPEFAGENWDDYLSHFEHVVVSRR